MRLIDVLPGRPLRPVRTIRLGRPKRQPTYVIVEQTQWGPSERQATFDEALYFAVLEVLDSGEETLSKRGRERVVEHFRRRAHLEMNSISMARAFGISRQRIDQLEGDALRKLERARTAHLASVSIDERDTVIQVRRLEDMVHGRA